jgi:urease accessory protein UreH
MTTGYAPEDWHLFRKNAYLEFIPEQIIPYKSSNYF